MTPTTDLPRLDPPQRLLAGPGPSNVEPAVLEAMQKPMLGHLDPDLHEILLELVDFQRRVYNAESGLVFPHQATGSSGMECGLVNLLEPGDTAIVAVTGFFGNRIARMAERTGAKVVEVRADYGQIAPNEALLDAIDANPDARLVAVVHAETSTGVRHPVEELGRELQRRGSDTLLFVDCVTSLGAHPVEFDAWGFDYAYSCTQKALAAPPGMSPVAISDRALERVAARKTPVPFTFDLDLLRKYWIDRPITYHHTAPILHIYALHEALRGVLDEGLENRFQRHADAGGYLQDAGPQPRPRPARRPRLPAGAAHRRVRPRGRRRQGRPGAGSSRSTTSRSAAGSAPTPRPSGGWASWADNARRDAADQVLAALDAVLADTKQLASTA